MFDAERAQWLVSALAPERKTHVVDVGANPFEGGDAPYAGLLKAQHCRITGFEPQKEAFDHLQQIKGAEDVYLPHAVGDGGTVPLYLTRGTGFVSTLYPDARAAAYLGPGFARDMEVQDTPLMETRRIDDLDEITPFDLLKIDIQGGECAVFQGGSRKLASAVAVIPEIRFYQIYRNEPMFAGIDADLRARGFVLHKFLGTKAFPLQHSQMDRLRHRKLKDQLVDGDAVYIRDLARPEGLGDEQLKHLAILADSVWFSFGQVVQILDLLVARGAIAKDIPSLYVEHMPPEFVA